MSRKVSILIIEQDPEEVARLESLVADLGFEVRSASGGPAALEIARAWRPHVVMLSAHLDDFQPAQFIESFLENGDASFVLMADESLAEPPEELVEHISELIRKPIQPYELRLRLRAVSRGLADRSRMKARIRDLEREKDLISRYVSQELREKILDQETGKDHQYVTSSILFFDIRNSTRIAEQLEPHQFAEFLGELIFDVMDLIYGNGGFVNKLLGDGLLATFGCPDVGEQDALNACLTAVQIRKHLELYNSLRSDVLKEPVAAGQGIATGTVFAGTIGSVHRMEYSVLGDPVNIAARLQALTKLAGADILIDEATRAPAGDALVADKIDMTHVPGRLGKLDIYSLLSAREDAR